MRLYPPTVSLVALLAVLLANTAAPRTAEATSALALSIPEMTQVSAAVVVGTVGGSRQEVHPQQLRPVTSTTLTIEKTLAGNAPSELEVRQWRGTLDGRSSAVPGDPDLESGTRGVFFLRQVDGQWFLTALSQSVFTLGAEADPRLDRTVDVALFVRLADGSLQRLAQPLPVPETLSAMKTALQGLPVQGPEVSP